MRTRKLFEEIQKKIILDLKEDEVPCLNCKGLRFCYVEENGKGYVEPCRECNAGKLYVCKHCKKANKNNYCNCNKAREVRNIARDTAHYEKAEKLNPEQCNSWVYAEGIGYNEGYFESVDALIEHCEDEGMEIPDWVYCCVEQKHKLDIDCAIEHMLDDAFEGARDCLTDEKELCKFVEEWNAKQNIVSYYPDYKKVVILQHAAER